MTGPRARYEAGDLIVTDGDLGIVVDNWGTLVDVVAGPSRRGSPRGPRRHATPADIAAATPAQIRYLNDWYGAGIAVAPPT